MAAGILFRVRARGDPPLGSERFVCMKSIKTHGFLYISALTFGFAGVPDRICCSNMIMWQCDDMMR